MVNIGEKQDLFVIRNPFVAQDARNQVAVCPESDQTISDHHERRHVSHSGVVDLLDGSQVAARIADAELAKCLVDLSCAESRAIEIRLTSGVVNASLLESLLQRCILADDDGAAGGIVADSDLYHK